MSASVRPPLVNRTLVGILAVVCVVGGLSVVFADSFQNPWGGSLIRVGVVLVVLWAALPTSTRAAAWSGMSPWVTVISVLLAIFAARRPLIFFPLAGVVMMIGLLARPRRRPTTRAPRTESQSRNG